MRVEKEIRNEWENLYLKGDYQLIASQNPALSKEAIRVCIRNGEFRNWAVFESVFKFYHTRKILSKGIAEIVKNDA